MRIIYALLIILFAFRVSAAEQNNTYQFSVDLTQVTNDQLKINLICPVIQQDSIAYRLPAIVPGTYKVYNFGRFSSSFEAFDKEGKPLKFRPVDLNTWMIYDAKKLHHITYLVEDSWDTKQKNDFVFEPAGTNFERDTNFVLNHQGLFGYFDNMKRNTFVVSVTRPSAFFGATGLTQVERKGNTDIYTIASYMELVDSPIMYCVPDTTQLHVGGADILISVYSPNKLVTSKFVADSLRLILEYQRQYLGGSLPVKNYAFIIYLTDRRGGFKSGSYGALEHSYSSMYTLLEMEPASIAQTVKDVAAHEFFHIVTPLNIHSEEIGDFDYNKPEMSQHLWMYEGLTEYAAHHVQVKYGSMSMFEFLEVIREKMSNANNRYNDELSFTEMSKNCLGKTEEEYGNVYQKGALIAMCLDLKLRHLSGGTYGTQELMRDLSLKYGKDRSFQDDSLFSDIVKLTYPEIGEFFNLYVIGSEPLPFAEVFAYAGIEYKRKKEVIDNDPLGGFGMYVDDQNQVRLVPVAPNEFGRDMGYLRDDILVSINGTKIKAGEHTGQIRQITSTLKDGTPVEVKVKRENSKGKLKTITLNGQMRTEKKTVKNYLSPMPDASPEQLKIRKAWINK